MKRKVIIILILAIIIGSGIFIYQTWQHKKIAALLTDDKICAESGFWINGFGGEPAMDKCKRMCKGEIYVKKAPTDITDGNDTYYCLGELTKPAEQKTSSQITEKDLLGLWTNSIDGEETMNFYLGDGGAHMYGSYSHSSPFAIGTWTLDNGKLTVNFESDIQPKVMTFSVTRQGDTLTLKTADGKVSTHTFIRQ